MKSLHSCFAALLLIFLSWGTAASQPDVLQIPLPVEMITYALAPDGATAAVYPHPNLVREEPPEGRAFIQMVDLASGAATLSLTDLPDWTSDAAYLPDGRLLTAHLNGDFILWDASTGAIERQWWTGLYQSRIRTSPDGTRAYVLNSGTVSTFFEMDLATGALLRAMGRHPATLFDLLGSQADIAFRGDFTFVDFALSPDGASLAYANADGAIFAMDLASQVATLARPPSEQPMIFDARTLRFAPDSQSLFYLQFGRDARQVMHVSVDSTPIESYGDSVVAYAVSPDAARIAWVERSDDAFTLFVLEAGSEEAQVAAELSSTGFMVPPLATLNFALGGTHLVLDVVGDGNVNEGATLLVIPLA